MIDEKENSGSNFGEKRPGLGKILYVQLVKMLNKNTKWDKTAEYISPSPDPTPNNKIYMHSIRQKKINMCKSCKRHIKTVCKYNAARGKHPPCLYIGNCNAEK